jgi:hypothetical protein
MQAVGEADMQMAPAAQLISTATDAGGVAVNLVALLLGSTLLAGIFTTILRSHPPRRRPATRTWGQTQ